MAQTIFNLTEPHVVYDAKMRGGVVAGEDMIIGQAVLPPTFNATTKKWEVKKASSTDELERVYGMAWMENIHPKQTTLEDFGNVIKKGSALNVLLFEKNNEFRTITVADSKNVTGGVDPQVGDELTIDVVATEFDKKGTFVVKDATHTGKAVAEVMAVGFKPFQNVTKYNTLVTTEMPTMYVVRVLVD